MTASARDHTHPRRQGWVGLVIATLILLVAVATWAYFRTRPESAVVARRDIVGTVALSGEVIAPPLARAEIAVPYRAPVARVYASVGDRVRRGDVLLELSYPSAQIAYQQTRDRVKAAETALANARQQYSASVQSARQAYETARAAELKARQAAAGTGAATDANAAVLGQTPSAGGAEVTGASPPDLEQATADRVAAEQVLAQAQTEMNAALAPYQRELEAAREAFREAQSGRKQALVRSPIRGTVLALNARPGQEVGDDPKAAVATVVDLSDLEVHTALRAAEAAVVKPDLPVTMTVEELPNQPFEGEVERVTSTSSRPHLGQQAPNVEYTTIIDFRNENGLVKPGMKASVAVKTGEARDVLAVPSAAVDKDETGRPVVKVLRNGRWEAVVVETGLSDGQYTEIKTGLKAGDRVQVTPELL